MNNISDEKFFHDSCELKKKLIKGESTVEVSKRSELGTFQSCASVRISLKTMSFFPVSSKQKMFYGF